MLNVPELNKIGSDQKTDINNNRITRMVDVTKRIMDVVVNDNDDILHKPESLNGLKDYNENMEAIITTKLKHKLT